MSAADAGRLHGWPHYGLILSGNCSPSYNMAFDEDLARTVIEGKLPPTLRIYGWDRTSLTLGRFQQKLDRVNISFLQQRAIPVVRRPTGGRAILHGEDITYSFCSRYDGPFKGKGLRQCYELISRAIMKALDMSGIYSCMERAAYDASRSGSPHCFQSVSYAELTVNGRKIVGSAQRRWPEGFLQQGSIPVRIGQELNAGVFEDFEPEKMISLTDVAPEFDKNGFITNLKKGFETVLDAPLAEICVPAEESAGLTREFDRAWHLPGYPSAESLQKYQPLSF